MDILVGYDDQHILTVYSIVLKYCKLQQFSIIRDVNLLNECALFAWFVTG